MTRHVVVDGRVFSGEAADRGMGRYVDHVASTLVAAGHRVTLLLIGNQSRFTTRGVATERLPVEPEPRAQSTALNRLLERIGADVYVDGTPFLWPSRLDLSACPVVAVLFDLIPMRFLNDYIVPSDEALLDVYVNGLARVRKADHVIAISNVVKEHALRYLGIPRTRVDVVPPSIDPVYEAAMDAAEARAVARNGSDPGTIVCIQGAHRSKNFPAAVRFLEALSAATGIAADVVVPTSSQRVLIDGVRREGAGTLRVRESIPEEEKLALQRGARVIAHLSLEEGYGIPLAEALALDRPIICIDNAINRELLCGVDAARAGVLLLNDPSLESARALEAATRFVASADTLQISSERARIAGMLAATRTQGRTDLVRAVNAAVNAFQEWHSRAGVAIVTPTDFGSCEVADYCHALLRDGGPRYAILLGAAPRQLQLLPHLRLLPFEAVDQVRRRAPALLFNLSTAKTLVRTFDEIALRSRTDDILVVHGEGSYLPRWLKDAARGERSPELERCLRDESDEVKALVDAWLREAAGSWAEADAMLPVIDRRVRSSWLRGFRGVLVGHDPAFVEPSDGMSSAPDSALAADSEIRTRTRYLPLPIDLRLTAGIAELAEAFRFSHGLTRHDLVVGCVGALQELATIARTVARLHADRSTGGKSGGLALIVVGATPDDAAVASARAEFAARGVAARFVCADPSDQTHEDAALGASDVVIAFRARGAALGRTYALALALGRPVITNDGAVLAEAHAAVVCRDEALEDDLYARLDELARSGDLRERQAALSLAHYRERHAVDRFFARVRALNPHAAAV